eukprot:1550330-Amphidinium_carterae.1
MFATLLRGTRFAGRVSKPAAYIGKKSEQRVGYVACVVQNRDETALELAAASMLNTWACLMQGRPQTVQ